jgi:hypothetical protein
MQVTRSGGTGYVAYAPVTTVVGKTYVASAVINSVGSQGALYVRSDTSANNGAFLGGATGPTTGNTSSVNCQFTAVGTTSYIYFVVDSNGTSIRVDDVSCRLAEPDRSVLKDGLQVYGSLTKSAVATGSDLMAYSGWSASNYLFQPANINLDPGSTEVTVAFWIKSDFTTITSQYAVHRGTNDATESLRVAINSSSLYFDYGNGQAYVTVPTPPSNVWVHIVCTVRSGTLGRVYVNGVPQTNIINGAVAPTTFLNGTDYAMSVGSSWVYGGPVLGSMALFRYSLTAVSPEQALKMYDDEKLRKQFESKALARAKHFDVSEIIQFFHVAFSGL